MAGSSPERGPAAFVDVPDVAGLEDALAGQDPPYGIRFSQGDGDVVAEIAAVDTSRGAGIAELYYDGGRYVTVDVPTQLHGVSE